MKMKKMFAMLLSATMIATAMAGCAADDSQTSGEGSAEEAIVIKMGHVLATNHPIHVTMLDAAERIKERTGGGVEIQVYPNGELSSYQDGVEAIISGAPYLFYSSPGQFSDYVPELAALQSPFLFETFDDYNSIVETPAMEGLLQQCSDEGITVLSINLISGFRHLLTDKAITGLDDLNNLKLRTSNSPVFLRPFEALGTNASAINWNETYQALQQGVVDAVETTAGNLYDAKMHEVKKELTKTSHLIDVSGIFIGTKFWDTIPAEYQDIISEEIDTVTIEHNKLAEQLEVDALQLLVDEGVTVHEIDTAPLAEATKDITLGFSIGQELIDAVEASRK